MSAVAKVWPQRDWAGSVCHRQICRVLGGEAAYMNLAQNSNNALKGCHDMRDNHSAIGTLCCASMT